MVLKISESLTEDGKSFELKSEVLIPGDRLVATMLVSGGDLVSPDIILRSANVAGRSASTTSDETLSDLWLAVVAAGVTSGTFGWALLARARRKSPFSLYYASGEWIAILCEYYRVMDWTQIASSRMRDIPYKAFSQIVYSKFRNGDISDEQATKTLLALVAAREITVTDVEIIRDLLTSLSTISNGEREKLLLFARSAEAKGDVSNFLDELDRRVDASFNNSKNSITELDGGTF